MCLIDHLRSSAAAASSVASDIGGDEALVLGGVSSDCLKAADEIERLRAALYQCGGMADEGISAPNAAYRWCERIEEVAMTGRPLEEYSKYLRRKER